jgi:hypothetical protein
MQRSMMNSVPLLAAAFFLGHGFLRSQIRTPPPPVIRAAPPVVRAAPQTARASAPSVNPGARPNGNTARPANGAPRGSRQTQASFPKGGGGLTRNSTPPKGIPEKAQFVPGQARAGMFATRDGREWELGSDNQVVRFKKPGMMASFGPDGKIASASVSRSGNVVQIARSSIGDRSVTVMRSNGIRVVASGPQIGYVQRPVVPGLVTRTYTSPGRTSVALFHPVVYGSALYYAYVPSVVYSPAFYAWAYNPWLSPAYFAWGWEDAPWYAFYAGYFSPARVYPNGALWVADYVIAQDLRLAYAVAVEERAVPTPTHDMNAGYAMPLSDETRSLIADQVRFELTNQQERAYVDSLSDGNNDALSATDSRRGVLLVSSKLAVAAGSQQCRLTPGDILIRKEIGSIDAKVLATVERSKPGDCPGNSVVALDLFAVQEMQNDFRRQIDAGLADLARQQGHNGLPVADSVSARALPGAGKLKPDSNIDGEIKRAFADADAAEAEIGRSATSSK